jgi:hypothetical protein
MFPLLCSPRIGFYKVRKLYQSWNNGPIGINIVQPMKQWGNKESRQVIWQRTTVQYIELIPVYVFTSTAWKGAKTTAHQRLIFKVKKLGEAFN